MLVLRVTSKIPKQHPLKKNSSLSYGLQSTTFQARHQTQSPPAGGLRPPTSAIKSRLHQLRQVAALRHMELTFSKVMIWMFILYPWLDNAWCFFFLNDISKKTHWFSNHGVPNQVRSFHKSRIFVWVFKCFELPPLSFLIVPLIFKDGTLFTTDCMKMYESSVPACCLREWLDRDFRSLPNTFSNMQTCGPVIFNENELKYGLLLPNKALKAADRFSGRFEVFERFFFFAFSWNNKIRETQNFFTSLELQTVFQADRANPVVSPGGCPTVTLEKH